VLTSEGAELRSSLSASEASNAKLEQELADIRGRLGYRIGRFLRRPFRRGGGAAG
jgi:hypothetical protein